MKKYFFLIIGILLLSFSISAFTIDKDSRVLNVPQEYSIKKIENKGLANSYKRIIEEDIQEKEIKSFKDKGCLIKHKVNNFVSFDCPKNSILSDSARESRVFTIKDISSDIQIDADLVWSDSIEGSGVPVVILDTGIDSSHFELTDSIIGQKDFVDNDDSAQDLNGHGTHVAGIIKANGNYTTPEG